jgi:hypothetical protein
MLFITTLSILIMLIVPATSYDYRIPIFLGPMALLDQTLAAQPLKIRGLYIALTAALFFPGLEMTKTPVVLMLFVLVSFFAWEHQATHAGTAQN